MSSLSEVVSHGLLKLFCIGLVVITAGDGSIETYENSSMVGESCVWFSGNAFAPAKVGNSSVVSSIIGCVCGLIVSVSLSVLGLSLLSS